MDNDRVKLLKREIETLQSELEHIFPEHERQYRKLRQHIQEKELELQSLQPPAASIKSPWWKSILKG